MKRVLSLLALTVMGAGLCAVSAQQSARGGVFTAAQAEKGRATYEKTCGQCHTPSLLGRTGDQRELPPLSSLNAEYRSFIGTRGTVPPLAGETFIDRWGSKTAGELISRFQETVDYFGFQEDKDTTVNITAYVLQVNGAKPGTQPMTRSTAAVVRSLTR